jgi:hypothetical protein
VLAVSGNNLDWQSQMYMIILTDVKNRFGCYSNTAVVFSLVSPSNYPIFAKIVLENILLTDDMLSKWKAEGVTDDVTGKLKNAVNFSSLDLHSW